MNKLKEMKLSRILYTCLLMGVLPLFFSSCLPDTELAPEPVEGSIIRFRIANSPDATVTMSGNNIAITLPIGSTLTGLIPEIIVSKGTTILDYSPGQIMDFTNDVIIKVKGTDNVVVEYLVKGEVKEPQPGFITPELLFERKHIDYAWPLHNVYSSAVSGENLLVLITNKIEKFNPYTGERTGQMVWAGVPMHQITNDSEGRVIGISVSNGGTVARIFKWENVDSAPVEILSWTVDLTANPVVGRNMLNVVGDISKNAVIYTAANGNPYVLRWTIKNGQFVSQAPEKIIYVSPTGQPNFPNVTPSVSGLGPNPEDGYVVTTYNRGYSHVIGDEVRIFNTAEAAGPIRSLAFDFNRAKYFVGALYNSSIFILDITNPDGIEMTEAERFEAGIEFKPFTSPTFPHNGGAANTTPHSGFSIKYNDDGTAILYYVFANSGIRAYKLTPKP